MKIYLINKNFNDGGGMIMTCVQFNPDRLNWHIFPAVSKELDLCLI